jgi:exodeoxyribonuclease V alpha subunit
MPPPTPALVGPVAHLDAGDRAEVSGEWQTHNRYGRQLRAQGALPLDPADREGQVAYLTSLRHIGPARAERLVDEHGEGVLQTIASNPHGVFRALRGVSEDQAAAAAESWHASSSPPTGWPTWRRRSTLATGTARWRSCTRTPTG